MDVNKNQQGKNVMSASQRQEIKLFQKWSFNDITVKDIGLQRYLNLTPMVAPHSMGRHEHQRFRRITSYNVCYTKLLRSTSN